MLNHVLYKLYLLSYMFYLFNSSSRSKYMIVKMTYC